MIVVKDEFAGRIGKCPGCQTSVKVPAPMPAFEVVEDEPAPPPAKKKPVIVVEDTPPPKKKPVVAVLDDEDAAPPPPKKKPVIVVEEDAPPPKKKPVIIVEEDDEDAPPPSKKNVVRAVVEDAEEVVPPAKWKKPAAAFVVEDAEEAAPTPPKATPKPLELDDAQPAGPPKRGSLRKATPANYDDDILGRTVWLVREDQGMFSGNTRAGLFETPESKEAYAVVRDATYKVFGFLNIDVMGFRPQFKFELRRGDKNGPVLLTIARLVPRFDNPFKAKQPIRWEVRGPDGAIVGSVTISRAGFSLLKFISKGQLFQEECELLDASGRRCGSVAIERAMMGAPTYLGIVDEDGKEYGHFTTQFGKKLQPVMEEVKRTGKIKVMTSVSVMGKGDEDERGYYGHVNPERVTDPYARVMTLAMAILLENLGYEAFGRTKSRAK